MKKIIKNVFFVALSAFALGACKAELETTPVTTNGKIDLTRYVAVGNSLTAGFADNGVYLESQQNSYPLFISEQFAKAGGGSFIQPLFGSDKPNGSGYIRLVAGNDAPRLNSPLSLTSAAGTVSVNDCANPTAPKQQYGVDAASTFGFPGSGGRAFIAYTGTSNQNLGVPGIRVLHTASPLFRAYSIINPFFERLITDTQRSAGGITYVDYVAASKPTFFTCWLGNNDVLSYATNGGETEGNPNDGGSNSITSLPVFTGSYTAVINALTANGAKGVVATIPDVSALPYFTLVGANRIPRIIIRDNSLAYATTTSTFASGLPPVPLATGALFPGAGPNPTAQAIASFINAVYQNDGFEDPKFVPGENFPVFIVDATTTPKKVRKIDLSGGDYIATGPFTSANAGFFAQLTRINSATCMPATPAQPGGGGLFYTIPNANPLLPPTFVARPLSDNLILDKDEVVRARTATAGFNNAIKTIAATKGLPVFDAATTFAEIIANSGIDEVPGTTAVPTGGLFSLDGVHLTPRGYGAIANQFIKAINAGYNTSIPLLDVRQRGLRGVRIP